jgi:hypothetical protein
MVRENIKTLAKESPDHDELKHKPCSTKDAQNYYIKGNKLNCSYRNQVK